MSIPASHIVEVLPRVIAGGSDDLELNGLLFSRSDLISADTMALPFTNANAVRDYFGDGSAEYGAALIYFKSYTNKLASPKRFFVARRISADAPAWLRGGRISASAVPVAMLAALDGGAMVISIDGTAHALSLDFSGIGSYSDAAVVLQTALRDAAGNDAITVTWSSLSGAFTITSGTSGASSSVSHAAAPASGVDIAALLNLTGELGAVVSSGMDAMGVNAQMEAILARTRNWVSFATAWEAEEEEAMQWAAWANDHYGWLYVAYTTSSLATLPDSSADMASQIRDAGYDHTAVMYGPLSYAAFLMGVVASVAWQRANSAITAAFKKQDGLAAWVVDETTANTLEAKNCNYVGRFATRNAEFVFLFPGLLSASAYRFIDPYINSIWFNNRLQVALMDGITTTGRAPYNDRGYTRVRTWMTAPVLEARNNGVIDVGVQLSEAQKAEVAAEAGLDISSELWTQGYYIQVLDPGAAVRAERGSPIISLWYTYGGSIQKIEVASTAIL